MSEFINVLNKAIEEDLEVVRAIRNNYRGVYALDSKEVLKHNGDRVVFFRIPASRFEEVVINEIDKFHDGYRFYFSELTASNVFTVFSERRDGFVFIEYRGVTDDYEHYTTVFGYELEGYVICDKKIIEKVLKGRGWM